MPGLSLGYLFQPRQYGLSTSARPGRIQRIAICQGVAAACSWFLHMRAGKVTDQRSFASVVSETALTIAMAQDLGLNLGPVWQVSASVTLSIGESAE